MNRHELKISVINFSFKLILYPFKNVLPKIHFNQSYVASGIRQYLCNCYDRINRKKIMDRIDPDVRC